MKQLFSFFVIIIYSLMSSATIQAQFCSTPKPLPKCVAFLITEFGIYYRTTSSAVVTWNYFTSDSMAHPASETWDRTLYMTTDLGIMMNFNNQYSFGASPFLALDSDGEFRGGLKFRVRRWLSNGASIDLSPGIFLLETSDYFKTPGFTGTLDFWLKEWIALSVILEYMHLENTNTWLGPVAEVKKTENDFGIYLGMKSGSSVGRIALIPATIAGILYILISNQG